MRRIAVLLMALMLSGCTAARPAVSAPVIARYTARDGSDIPWQDERALAQASGQCSERYVSGESLTGRLGPCQSLVVGRVVQHECVVGDRYAHPQTACVTHVRVEETLAGAATDRELRLPTVLLPAPLRPEQARSLQARGIQYGGLLAASPLLIALPGERVLLLLVSSRGVTGRSYQLERAYRVTDADRLALLLPDPDGEIPPALEPWLAALDDTPDLQTLHKKLQEVKQP